MFRALVEDESFRVALADLCSTFYPDLEASGEIDCSDPEQLVMLMLAATSVDAEFKFEDNLEDLETFTTAGPVPVPITFVAATGNQGLPFPMPPADWPGVIQRVAYSLTNPPESPHGDQRGVRLDPVGPFFGMPLWTADSIIVKPAVGVAACVSGPPLEWTNASGAAVETLGARFLVPQATVREFADVWFDSDSVTSSSRGYYGTSFAAPLYALTEFNGFGC